MKLACLKTRYSDVLDFYSTLNFFLIHSPRIPVDQCSLTKPCSLGVFCLHRFENKGSLLGGKELFRFALALVLERFNAVLQVLSPKMEGAGLGKTSHSLHLHVTVTLIKHDDGLSAEDFPGLLGSTNDVLQFVFLFLFERFHELSTPCGAISWCGM